MYSVCKCKSHEQTKAQKRKTVHEQIPKSQRQILKSNEWEPQIQKTEHLVEKCNF